MKLYIVEATIRTVMLGDDDRPDYQAGRAISEEVGTNGIDFIDSCIEVTSEEWLGELANCLPWDETNLDEDHEELTAAEWFHKFEAERKAAAMLAPAPGQMELGI